MGNYHSARAWRAAGTRPGRTQLRRHGAQSVVGRRYNLHPDLGGFLYLAVVLDTFSRRIVGWAMETHLRTELVLQALNLALWQRRPAAVIHHSDQGSQGEFKRSSQHLDRGNCDDYSKAPFGLVRASTVAVAGPAFGSTTGEPSAVLGIDCGRPFK